jgi:hypothetical protein
MGHERKFQTAPHPASGGLESPPPRATTASQKLAVRLIPIVRLRVALHAPRLRGPTRRRHPAVGMGTSIWTIMPCRKAAAMPSTRAAAV